VVATTTKRPVCAACGAVLARDHAGEPLCSPCQAKAPESPTLRRLEPDELAYLVAAILLSHRALHPGKKVRLRKQLERCGIVATTDEIHHAVSKLRHPARLKVVAREREAGYLPLGFVIPLGRGRRPRSEVSQITLF
jgi:uncharacterized Zn finger protein (UPF0148 family)